MLLVVRHLNTATATRFLDGLIHRVGDLVSVHDYPAVGIARRAANGLNQGTMIAEETFLISIEDRHQRYFGQIQALDATD